MSTFTAPNPTGPIPIIETFLEPTVTTSLDFNDFYRAQYGRLAGTLRLVTGDAGIAEELTQEAFVKALQRWERVSAHESPEGWLFTTGLNLARRRWRIKKNRPSASLDETWMGESHPEPNSTRAELIAAIGRLPVKQRSAVVVRHVLGYSTDEAAALLEMSPGALRQTLHRAVSTLRLDPSFLEFNNSRTPQQ